MNVTPVRPQVAQVRTDKQRRANKCDPIDALNLGTRFKNFSNNENHEPYTTCNRNLKGTVHFDTVIKRHTRGYSDDREDIGV